MKVTRDIRAFTPVFAGYNIRAFTPAGKFAAPPRIAATPA